MRSVYKWTVAALIALGIIILITAIILARNERNFASNLILDLQQLRIGSSDARQVTEFVRKYDLGPMEVNPAADNNAYRIVLDNNVLARLHLAPWTRLGVLLNVKAGVLNRISAEYYVSCRGDLTSGVDIEEVVARPTVPPYHVAVIPLGGKPPSVKIELTSSASITERSKAFGFNTGCLVRLGGCRGASELVPTLGMTGLTCDTMNR